MNQLIVNRAGPGEYCSKMGLGSFGMPWQWTMRVAEGGNEPMPDAALDCPEMGLGSFGMHGVAATGVPREPTRARFGNEGLPVGD